MAFTEQNDEGTVVDANAYISVAFFTDYHTERGVTAVVDGEYSTEQIQSAIIAATDYIDNRWRFKGVPLGVAQSTEFPRDDLYDRYGNQIEGLPIKLKMATAEYALRALSGSLAPDPEMDERGLSVVSKREKVGPLEESTSYAHGTAIRIFRPYPLADRLLREFVADGRRVIRA